ncbi:MAG: hypothetical protein QXZ63_01935 [Sulfolobales archaeon]
MYIKHYGNNGYVSNSQKISIDLSYYLKLLDRVPTELSDTLSIYGLSN